MGEAVEPCPHFTIQCGRSELSSFVLLLRKEFHKRGQKDSWQHSPCLDKNTRVQMGKEMVGSLRLWMLMTQSGNSWRKMNDLQVMGFTLVILVTQDSRWVEGSAGKTWRHQCRSNKTILMIKWTNACSGSNLNSVWQFNSQWNTMITLILLNNHGHHICESNSRILWALIMSGAIQKETQG